MRKLVLTLIGISPIFAASLALAASDYTQTVESYNPIAYYQFSASNPTGSSVTSAAGVVYSGTLEGAPPATTNSAGPAIADDPGNTALNLTGNGTSGSAQQYFNTTMPADYTSDQINQSGSILAWINLASLPSTGGRIYYIAGESQNGDDFDLQIDPSDNSIRFYTDSGSYTASADLSSADLNQWIFVAATFTASTDRTVYINGVASIGTSGTSTPGGHGASSDAFTVGESTVFPNRYLDGSIDEVAFYNSDLSAADIANIYASADVPAVSAVPLPASLWGGAGLLGLLAAGMLHKRAAASVN